MIISVHNCFPGLNCIFLGVYMGAYTTLRQTHHIISSVLQVHDIRLFEVILAHVGEHWCADQFFFLESLNYLYMFDDVWTCFMIFDHVLWFLIMFDRFWWFLIMFDHIWFWSSFAVSMAFRAMMGYDGYAYAFVLLSAKHWQWWVYLSGKFWDGGQ